MSDDPRFSRKRDAAIPLDLKTIVLKALAKDPAERYATAGDLAGDLALFPGRSADPGAAADAGVKGGQVGQATREGRGRRGPDCGAAVDEPGRGEPVVECPAADDQPAARGRDRAGRSSCAREAQDHAGTSERHALGAQLRLAAQALDAAQPERAQVILRDIPINAGGEAPRSFAWRHLRRRARRDIVVLFGPSPRFVAMALSPDGKIVATTDDSRGLELWDAATGERIRAADSGEGRYGKPVFSLDGSLVAARERTADVAAPDGFSVWDVASGRRLARLPMGQDLRRCLLCGSCRGGHSWAGHTPPSGCHLIRRGSGAWPTTRHDPACSSNWKRSRTWGPAWTGTDLLTRDDRSSISLRDARHGRADPDFSCRGCE